MTDALTAHSATTATPAFLIPVDEDGNPITDEGQRAYLAGAIQSFKEWTVRTGHFV